MSLAAGAARVVVVDVPCNDPRRAYHRSGIKAAAEATKKAYRYVTDDCWIKGRKYEYPLEFWVGPYVYWLFTEYLDTVGPDDKFEDWLRVLDQRWSVERGVWMPRQGTPHSRAYRRRSQSPAARGQNSMRTPSRCGVMATGRFSQP